MKLRGLVPNFYIHVPVNDLYIPIAHRYMSVEIGNEASQFRTNGWGGVTLPAHPFLQ
jgi:hypothetical protein